MRVRNPGPEVTKPEIEDNVFTLLNYSRVFAGWAVDLRETFDRYAPSRLDSAENRSANASDFFHRQHAYLDMPAVSFMSLQINLYFLDALLSMHSVLFGRTDGEFAEWGLPLLYDRFGQAIFTTNPDVQSELTRIQHLYTRSDLKTIRHKFLAHSDVLASFPAGKHLGPYNLKHLQSLTNVGNEVYGFCMRSFESPYVNDPVADFYAEQYAWMKGKILREITSG